MFNSRVRVTSPKQVRPKENSRGSNKNPSSLVGSNIQNPFNRIVGSGRIVREPSANPLDNLNNLLVSISDGSFWLNALAIILGIVLLIISMQGLIYAEFNPLKKITDIIPQGSTKRVRGK